jgi:hypothetical protein
MPPMVLKVIQKPMKIGNTDIVSPMSIAVFSLCTYSWTCKMWCNNQACDKPCSGSAMTNHLHMGLRDGCEDG